MAYKICLNIIEMKTAHGQLTYCSNIHTGETWTDHFQQLKTYIPAVKKVVSPDQPFGIGLRLAHNASVQLSTGENLKTFQEWLEEEGCYVVTMNGFPYGGFHDVVVKDEVHAPDWTTTERVEYTNRLADLLAILLPEGMDGGISTSPLSYRYWHKENERGAILEETTLNVLQVVTRMAEIKKRTGKLLHLDIEPEPDGLVENGNEFFAWYREYLMPMGTVYLVKQFGYAEAEAAATLKDHVQLCYDVCHFAVGYEDHALVLEQATEAGIRIGRIQISAALKALLEGGNREAVFNAFREFNEPTYLHQVIARRREGPPDHFSDLPQALEKSNDPDMLEWRAHFHVPLFVEDYGVLQSTQQDIRTVLAIQQDRAFTNCLEIETYTWDVLPAELKLPLLESVIREFQWVKATLGIK